ncbi:MAG: stage V sporulation protein AE [Clostridia bacterium]|nr:stage V sporulation protein AE [Clostridia bacterium]
MKDCILAFVFGGTLCVIGQLFIDLTKLTPARILVCYVTVGVLLGAVGIYKPLVEIFGCGASVPLTGFGYTLAKGVKEAVEEQGLLGVLTGGLSGAAAGITAAMLFGFLAALISRPRTK